QFALLEFHTVESRQSRIAPDPKVAILGLHYPRNFGIRRRVIRLPNAHVPIARCCKRTTGRAQEKRCNHGLAEYVPPTLPSSHTNSSSGFRSRYLSSCIPCLNVASAGVCTRINLPSKAGSSLQNGCLEGSLGPF